MKCPYCNYRMVWQEVFNEYYCEECDRYFDFDSLYELGIEL